MKQNPKASIMSVLKYNFSQSPETTFFGTVFKFFYTTQTGLNPSKEPPPSVGIPIKLASQLDLAFYIL